MGKFKKGWHNLVVTCDNAVEMKITFYLDGKQTKESQNIMCNRGLGYVGNCKMGTEPFGTIADLRVYPYLLKAN